MDFFESIKKSLEQVIKIQNGKRKARRNMEVDDSDAKATMVKVDFSCSEKPKK